MKFEYVAMKDGKKFQKSVTVRSLEQYYDFIDRKNAAHEARATGFHFYSM